MPGVWLRPPKNLESSLHLDSFLSHIQLNRCTPMDYYGHNKHVKMARPAFPLSLLSRLKAFSFFFFFLSIHVLKFSFTALTGVIDFKLNCSVLSIVLHCSTACCTCVDSSNSNILLWERGCCVKSTAWQRHGTEVGPHDCATVSTTLLLIMASG